LKIPFPAEPNTLNVVLGLALPNVFNTLAAGAWCAPDGFVGVVGSVCAWLTLKGIDDARSSTAVMTIFDVGLSGLCFGVSERVVLFTEYLLDKRHG